MDPITDARCFSPPGQSAKPPSPCVTLFSGWSPGSEPCSSHINAASAESTISNTSARGSGPPASESGGTSGRLTTCLGTTTWWAQTASASHDPAHAMKQLLKAWVTARKQYHERRELAAWERQGRPVPPPHVVKQRVLQGYAERYRLKIFIETGTYRSEERRVGEEGRTRWAPYH